MGILFWITHTMIFTPVSVSRAARSQAALTFDIKYDVSYTFPKQNEFCAPLSLGGRVANMATSGGHDTLEEEEKT